MVGQQRTLAFASEGAVAGEALIPRPVYYGLWGLSGLAIVGDIATKTIGKAIFQFKFLHKVSITQSSAEFMIFLTQMVSF